MHVTGSLQKTSRSKNWYMVIYSQGRKNPKWYSTKTNNKTKAQEILRKKLNELEYGIDVDRNITMSKLLDLYINYAENIKEPPLEYNTLRPYKGIVKNHLKPYFGNIALDSLSPLLIDEYFTELKNKYASGTVKQHFTVLNNALNYAKRKRMLAYNPAEGTELPAVVQKEFDVWPIDVCKRFIEEIKESKYQVAFLLAIATGQREGEICALKIEDYDKESGYLTVGHSIDYLKQRKSTKSKRSRTFKLPALVTSVLDLHIAKLKFRMRIEPNYNKDGYICPSVKGEVLNPRTLYAAFKTFIARHGFPDIRFHDLRHTFATFTLEDGVIDIKTVSNMLGHAKVDTTRQLYQKVTPKMKEDASDYIQQKLYE